MTIQIRERLSLTKVRYEIVADTPDGAVRQTIEGKDPIRTEKKMHAFCDQIAREHGARPEPIFV